MTERFARFITAEDGAITVDWVVLTALIVALAAAAFSGVEGGVEGLTNSIRDYLSGLLA
ncbi:MAG: hypothetical protein KDK24_04325 [Pseudooceanicola sp.]|nr:hypothetical protein [Pseudooceanicola sp.]